MNVPAKNFLTFLKLQERAEKLYLHYIQRWAKDYLRRRLDWIVDDLYGRQEYASNTNPRHLNSALCPCQVDSSTIMHQTYLSILKITFNPIEMIKYHTFIFQYIEEHLRNKRQRESLNPCATSANPCLWCD